MSEITIRGSRVTCDWRHPVGRGFGDAAGRPGLGPGPGHNSAGTRPKVTFGSHRGNGYYRIWIVRGDGRRVDSFLRKGNAAKKAAALRRAGGADDG